MQKDIKIVKLPPSWANADSKLFMFYTIPCFYSLSLFISVHRALQKFTRAVLSTSYKLGEYRLYPST